MGYCNITVKEEDWKHKGQIVRRKKERKIGTSLQDKKKDPCMDNSCGISLYL